MALFGLFGKKRDEESGNTNDQSEAYFLDADQAKTFGNIDYMRKSVSVRRTFPGTAGNGGEFEQVKSVSGISGTNGSSNVVPKSGMNGSVPNAAPTPEQNNGSAPENKAERRRSTNDGMDMFRRMARDLKK